MEGDNISKLWRYDPTKDSWEVIDVKSPGGSPALCVLGDDLFFVEGMYAWEFENAEKACAARIDVDKKTITLVNAKTEEQASQLREGYTLAAASANNIYLYQMISGGTIPVAHHLYRLTYDKAANTMDFEDLTSAFTEVAPPIEQSAEEGGKKAFTGCKSLKKLIMKSKKLAKKRVKGSLKGSSVKTVKMKLSTAKANKTYAKKYAKFLTKANSGKKARVVR